MLANNLQNVFYLFVIICSVAFLFPLFKQGIVKQLGFAASQKSMMLIAAVAGGYAILFGVSEVLKMAMASLIPAFLGAMALAWLLSALKMPAHLRGILLLGAAMLLMSSMHEANTRLLIAACLGLVTWKMADMVYCPDDPDFLDVLPALTLLSGVIWVVTGLQSSMAPPLEGVLIGSLATVYLIRLFQNPFMSDDKWYLKRLILSATGGLVMLIINTKVLLLPEPGAFAWLVGGGMFVSYFFRDFEDRIKDKLNNQSVVFEFLSMLVLIGIATVAASRLFGTFGLVVLAATTLVTRPGSVAQMAGLFWVTRALLQNYIYDHVANVTGVNVLHPYVAASIYGGIVVALVLAVVLRDIGDRRLKLLLFLMSGTLLPVVANLFLHAEPTAGLFDASMSAAIIVAVFAPALFRAYVGSSYILLVPAQMMTLGMITSDLITIGNEAVGSTKMQMLAGVALVVALVPLAIMLFIRVTGSKQVEVSRD